MPSETLLLSTPASGRQIRLRHSDYTADIATVGASLRSLRYGKRDLVVSFGQHQVRPLYRGATLAPWPNRIVDGRYTFNGRTHQLPLNEPERGHALHGLVAWHDWTAAEHESESAAVLTTTIPAQSGYPFQLHLRMDVSLDADGYHSSLTATNQSAAAAPYGTAPHPYITAGQGTVDNCHLRVPATNVLTVTEDRLIPQSVVPVDSQPALDFRTLSLIGSTKIDHAYTQLHRDRTGLAEVRLLAPDGTGTAVSWGEECGWVQIHTADRPEPENDRIGLAVEPMTCPPDAFNSGTDLITLPPGGSHTASWTIRAIRGCN